MEWATSVSSCKEYRPQRLRDDRDRHSPGDFRANGTVRNMAEWYAAYNVGESAKLYLPPDQRVRIW